MCAFCQHMREPHAELLQAADVTGGAEDFCRMRIGHAKGVPREPSDRMAEAVQPSAAVPQQSRHSIGVFHMLRVDCPPRDYDTVRVAVDRP